jgi:hypothetical protein
MSKNTWKQMIGNSIVVSPAFFFDFIGVLVVITIKHTGIELNKYPLSDFVIGYYRFIRSYTWFVRVCYSLFKRDNHVQTTTMQ